MTATAGLLLNGLCVALLGPSVLERSARRVSPGSAILVWTAAMAAVLISWAAAAVVAGITLFRSDGHLHWLVTGCLSAVQSLLGTTYGEAVQLGLLAIVGVAVLAVLFLLVRLLIILGRTRSRTHRHCRIAWLIGERRLGPTDALLLDTAERCVYCVAGRPAAIVVTRGALEALNDTQLAAVLAHERAHLDERHHLLVALTRGTAAVLPRVRLFRAGARAIARLIEMRADDVALRGHTAPALAGALLALSGGTPLAATALGATSSDVTERVERLLVPPAAERASTRAQLGVAMAMLLVAPVLSLGLVTAAAPLCRILLG